MACSGIRLLATASLGAAALVGCGNGDATGPNGNGSDDSFEWSGTIAQGDEIEIKGVQGSITATGTSGGQVEVRATKSGSQDDPAEVVGDRGEQLRPRVVVQPIAAEDGLECDGGLGRLNPLPQAGDDARVVAERGELPGEHSLEVRLGDHRLDYPLAASEGLPGPSMTRPFISVDLP